MFACPCRHDVYQTALPCCLCRDGGLYEAYIRECIHTLDHYSNTCTCMNDLYNYTISILLVYYILHICFNASTPAIDYPTYYCRQLPTIYLVLQFVVTLTMHGFTLM